MALRHRKVFRTTLGKTSGKRVCLEVMLTLPFDMNYTFDFASVLDHKDLFLYGLWTTMKLSALATVLGFIVGTAIACIRLSQHKLTRFLAARMWSSFVIPRC